MVGDVDLRPLVINFMKGMLIGVGALLPGLSGGALAAVFGIYEPLIGFVSNIRKDFRKNIQLFIPVVLGGIFGVFILAHLLSYFLTHNLTEISLFFVGCLLGVFPALVKQARREGSQKKHIVMAIGTACLSFWLLSQLTGTTLTARDAGFGTWILSGGILGIGVTFPGLSPSNFLMYLDLYRPLNEAISQLDTTVLVPVFIGGLLSFTLTAKLVSYLLKIAYATMFHVIIGLVITSTVMIIPKGFTLNWITTLCLIAGLGVGAMMSKLDNWEN